MRRGAHASIGSGGRPGEYFNVATTLRQKWNDSGEIAAWIPLPLLGVPPWLVSASFSIKQVHQLWIYPKGIEKWWRPVEYIFSTASHHRADLGRNCGGILIVWDRRFGTVAPELSRRTKGSPSRWTPSTSGRCRRTNTARSCATSGGRPAGEPVRLRVRIARLAADGDVTGSLPAVSNCGKHNARQAEPRSVGSIGAGLDPVGRPQSKGS
jgi:hypothetical protein